MPDNQNTPSQMTVEERLKLLEQRESTSRNIGVSLKLIAGCSLVGVLSFLISDFSRDFVLNNPEGPLVAAVLTIWTYNLGMSFNRKANELNTLSSTFRAALEPSPTNRSEDLSQEDSQQTLQ
jgi:hypothetical protein